MSSRVIKSATHRQPLGCHHVPVLFSNTLVAVQKLASLPIFELRGIRSLLSIKVGLNATESVAFRPVDKHSVNGDDDK